LLVSPSIPCTISGSTSTETCLSTACVKIQAQNRGLQNVTCSSTSTADSNWSLAGIYLDSYGTSLKNIHVEGFQDGIVIGDNADSEGGLTNGNITTPSVGGIVIDNAEGAYGSASGPVRNTVHICNASNVPSSGAGACSSASVVVRDLTVIESTSLGNNGGTTGPNYVASPLEDDNTTTGQLVPSEGLSYVGLYTIGNPGANTYTRFTTSPNAGTPTWGVGAFGNSTPAGSCSNIGSILSNTSGTSAPASGNDTIWVCVGTGGSGTWVAIG
jgi:hypothetical protein